MQQMQKQENRKEAAIYWSAVSLIVCEGLPIDKAAEQLGVGGAELREILHRRQTSRAYETPAPKAHGTAVVLPFARP